MPERIEAFDSWRICRLGRVPKQSMAASIVMAFCYPAIR
jgi:hypothetical protein